MTFCGDKPDEDGVALTEFHADVLVRVFLPEFFVAVCVAHEREHYILNDSL